MQKVLRLFLHKQPAHQALDSNWTAQQAAQSGIQPDRHSHPETFNECSNVTDGVLKSSKLRRKKRKPPQNQKKKKNNPPHHTADCW